MIPAQIKIVVSALALGVSLSMAGGIYLEATQIKTLSGKLALASENVKAQAATIKNQSAIITATKSAADKQAQQSADLAKRLDAALVTNNHIVYVKVRDANNAVQAQPPAPSPDLDWRFFANLYNGLLDSAQGKPSAGSDTSQADDPYTIED